MTAISPPPKPKYPQKPISSSLILIQWNRNVKYLKKRSVKLNEAAGKKELKLSIRKAN